MKILILGTGGIGGYYGGRLLESGAEVFFVARGKHLEALQTNGLNLTSVNGDFSTRHVKASHDPKDAGPIDIVMHCTKTWDLEEAAALLKPVLKENTVIVTLQNGIDNTDRLAKHFERKHLAGGLAYGVVRIAGPGQIEHSSKNVHKIMIGSFPGYASETLRLFFEACRKAKFDAEWSDDIQLHLWKKFMFICAYSGVTSLIRQPIGPIRVDPDTRGLFQDCMIEIRNIARAAKVPLSDEMIEDRLAFVDALEPTATSSMQRDLENGHRMELESLNGTVSRLGRELGIATPINDFIYKSLKLYAKGA